jgi:hypothetical protein
MSENKKVGYVFQASMQIGEGIAISVSGNFQENSDSKEMVKEMDKVLAALEVQNVKRMKIPAVKGALRDQEDAVVRDKKHIEELKFKQQESKLNQHEKAQLESSLVRLKQIEEQVEKGREILAALEKEAE